MSTDWRWSGALGLLGICLSAATPHGDGCGGHCGDHCGGPGGAPSGGGGAGGVDAGTGPSGAGLTILATTSAGEGCPSAGAVDAWYDADARALVLTYPPFSISKSTPGFDHSSCGTGLTVKGVPGWQFAATGAALHGEAGLPQGAKIRLETSVFFAGLPASGERTTELVGPRTGTFDDDGAFPGHALWSPCGQDTIFTIQLGASVQSSVSSPAGASVQTITLPVTWHECG